jgi:hypothetical protein
MDYYHNEKEIEAVVQGFESCTTGKGEFKHGSHLTVAVWYLSHSTPEKALQQIRTGLFRFLDHHGVGREKYNETLTVFWIKLVENAISKMDLQTSLLHKTNTIVECLADPRVVFEYYSEACLKSESARTGWVAPDLKKL